jgi:hypothetical protein
MRLPPPEEEPPGFLPQGAITANNEKMPSMNGTRLSGNPVALVVGDFMELAAR